MSPPINLNKARKARARAAAKQAAAENRVRHGRSKAVKAADAREAERQVSAVVPIRQEKAKPPTGDDA